ncbi:hypothetical protein [Bradyrhizobium sp.]
MSPGFFFNLGAQVSGFTNAHLAAALVLMAGVPVAWKAGRWIGGKREKPKVLFYAVTGLIGAIILALMVLLAIFISSSQEPTSAGNVNQAQDKTEQVAGPRYVSGIRFLVDPGGGARLVFSATNYLDRLRIYVEFSGSNGGVLERGSWGGEKRKMLLADLRDVTKGEEKIAPLIYEVPRTAEQKVTLAWGDPNVKLDTALPILRRSKNRARIIFVGPDNKEQKYKLLVIRSVYDTINVQKTDAPTLMFLDENEVTSSFEWPEE